MNLLVIPVIISLLNCLASGVPFEIVSRKQWCAKQPTAVEPMTTPVPFVIIHHSYIPKACYSFTSCAANMREMQRMHQEDNGWNDIGYSFGSGGDGRIYEGRGWSNVGAHAPLYNDRSIGICLMGDWRYELPPEQQLKAVQTLIDFGVRKGYIHPNYTLYGHQQVRNGTECPGEALLREISSWDHFSHIVAEKWYPKP